MEFHDKRESILGVPRWKKAWRALCYVYQKANFSYRNFVIQNTEP